MCDIIEIPTAFNAPHRIARVVEAIGKPLTAMQHDRLYQLHMSDPATRIVASPRCPCGCWELYGERAMQ